MPASTTSKGVVGDGLCHRLRHGRLLGAVSKMRLRASGPSAANAPATRSPGTCEKRNPDGMALIIMGSSRHHIPRGRPSAQPQPMTKAFRLIASTGIHKGDRDYQQDQVALLSHPRYNGCVLAVVADDGWVDAAAGARRRIR